MNKSHAVSLKVTKIPLGSEVCLGPVGVVFLMTVIGGLYCFIGRVMYSINIGKANYPLVSRNSVSKVTAH